MKEESRDELENNIEGFEKNLHRKLFMNIIYNNRVYLVNYITK
jgi:hypothetical protein